MRLSDYYEISQAPDRESFERRLVGFANEMDFGLISAVLVVDCPGRESAFISIGNTPEEYMTAYSKRDDWARDPVLQSLKTLTTPIVYDQSVYVQGGAGDLWEEQAVYGYRTGVSMALHLPGGRHFLMGVDRDTDLPSDDDRIMRMMADLQLLAVHAQDAAVRLLLDEAQRKLDLPRLTAREREVLHWTSEGKSSWEVGVILGTSEHTVNFHLRNLMAKLDVTSKHQAVLKALSLGLLAS
jgi:DNA-binding CsgD family transcriptional regulator